LLALTYGRGLATNPGSDVFCRRQMALGVGGFEDCLRGMFEDQAFLVKVYCAEAVYVADACWTRYRQHPHSMVSDWSRFPGAPVATLSFLAWADAYLAERGLARSEAGRRIRSALWRARHPLLARARRLVTSGRRRLWSTIGRSRAVLRERLR
jgi:hypothetical protein